MLKKQLEFITRNLSVPLCVCLVVYLQTSSYCFQQYSMMCRHFTSQLMLSSACVCRPRDDSSVDMSDHEEEFYYTEVEENVDSVTQTFADMQTTSPTRPKFAVLPDAVALPDHDYQRKVCYYEDHYIYKLQKRHNWINFQNM